FARFPRSAGAARSALDAEERARVVAPAGAGSTAPRVAVPRQRPALRRHPLAHPARAPRARDRSDAAVEVSGARSADAAVDVAIIGGGVIGLAIAREVARQGREVALLEAERSLGQHTSSRNSEVIHAGLYYPTGSLK